MRLLSSPSENTPKQSFKNISPPENKRVLCNICIRDIKGDRYRCIQCPDYDLVCTCCASYFKVLSFLFVKCQSCVSDRNGINAHNITIHATHTFSAVQATHHDTTPTNMPSASTTPPSDDTSRGAMNAVHSNIVCDMCNNTVVGVRHKCLDCPGKILWLQTSLMILKRSIL